MQIYLPVHQATCRKEILDRVDSFGFDNQAVVRYIKHFYNPCGTDISFCHTCVKAVAAKIIQSVHIQLTAYKLMEKAFWIFVFEDLNGKTKMCIRDRRTDQLMRDTFKLIGSRSCRAYF